MQTVRKSLWSLHHEPLYCGSRKTYGARTVRAIGISLPPDCFPTSFQNINITSMLSSVTSIPFIVNSHELTAFNALLLDISRRIAFDGPSKTYDYLR